MLSTASALLSAWPGVVTPPTPTATPAAAAADGAGALIADPCAASSAICHFVIQHTGNEWLASLASVVITRPLPILAILAGAVVVRWLLHRSIERVVARAVGEHVPGAAMLRVRAAARARGLGRLRGIEAARERLSGLGGTGSRRNQRAESMGSILRSLTTAVVYSTAGVMVLDQLGVNLAPLVASASIVGIALGFGSQALVKDILSGVFMLLEDAYGVGDVIEACGRTGVVESVGLRATRLRDVNGTVWHVRNGSIDDVGNFSHEWARALLDVPVSYTADVDHAMEVIESCAKEMYNDPHYAGVMLEEPEVWGVQDTTGSAVVIRLGVKTQPLKQWDVARELRRRLRLRMSDAGITRALDRSIVTFEGVDNPADPGAPPLVNHPTRVHTGRTGSDVLRP